MAGIAQAELDEPDDQLAALWALNLEQERDYKAKVDTPPGGPRFQKFMEEFQVRPGPTRAPRAAPAAPRASPPPPRPAQQEQQGLAAQGAAGAAPRVHMRSKL
jgi:hypothetical protein